MLPTHRGVGLDPGPGESRAGHDLVDLPVYETSPPNWRSTGRNVLSRLADPGQAPGWTAAEAAWSVSPVTSRRLVIGVRELVGESVLDRRVVHQWLHVRHVTAGVGDLVGGPHAQHRHRGQHAADHDQHRCDRSPPAHPAAPHCAEPARRATRSTSARRRSSSVRSSWLRSGFAAAEADLPPVSVKGHLPLARRPRSAVSPATGSPVHALIRHLSTMSGDHGAHLIRVG